MTGGQNGGINRIRKLMDKHGVTHDAPAFAELLKSGQARFGAIS